MAKPVRELAARYYLCKEEDCDSPGKTRGWCNRHYLRWWFHGNVMLPERPRGAAIASYKHGLEHTKAYLSWRGMFKRCYDPRESNYARYGGRGITVCDRWKDVTKFVEDMGERPQGLTLERIDTDGNYEPSNCRWATWTDQARNTSRNVLTSERVRFIRWAHDYCGRTKANIAAQLGVSPTTVLDVVNGKTWKEIW